MKSALATVLSGFQSLRGDDSRERPVDRLAALAAIQISRGDETQREACLCALGKILISFKWANQPDRQEAIEALAAVLLWEDKRKRNTWGLKISPKEAVTIARQAVMEFCVDFCPRCGGAQQVPDHGLKLEGAQPMKCCPPNPEGCGGTGKRRYSDAERAGSMGETFAKPMAEAHGIMAWAESLAVRQAKQMLERWT